MLAALTALQGESEEVEGFTRLDRSALWAINSAYWRESGHAAFQRDAVPFQATSDGSLAAATAALIASWRGQCTTLGRLLVIELGPGTGLFARALLRRGDERRSRGLPYPEIDYVGVDVASSMARDIARHALLDGRPSVRFIDCDLGGDLDPLNEVIAAARAQETPILVVGNYIFDSLPARSFRRRGGVLQELEVAVSRGGEEIVTNDVRSHLFRTRFAPCAADDAFAKLAASCVDKESEQVVVNSGALRCIEKLAKTIGKDGLILVNDYAIEADDGGGPSWQNFGGSIASGIHFATFDRHIAGGIGECIAPEKAVSFINSRLIGRPDALTRLAFARHFSFDAAKIAHGRIASARTAHSAGRHDEAVAGYQAAIAEQPYNWSVLVETAGFVLTALNRPDEAATLLDAALAENPVSTVAWNLRGDCHYRGNRFAEAAECYTRADEIAGGDARARLNLAYCAGRAEELEEALVWCARALAVDRSGTLHDDIIARQAEIAARVRSRP